MGAKISKRGSYNLKKREKESKRNKLEGRTSSIINLTLSQIYEDELKTPKLGNYEKHKDFGHIYEKENAINKDQPILNTIQNINDRSDSEREDYSNPDDEGIYQNIIQESNSNFEEQVEKKEERKRRKTWSQSEIHDGNRYSGIRNSISEEHWEDILNGGLWKNENDPNLAEQIEVKEDKSEEQVEVVVDNQKSEDSDIEELEVDIHENKNSSIDHDKGEQVLLTFPESVHNEEQVEVLSENICYVQIEVIADVQQNSLQEYKEVPTQAKPESIANQNFEFENKLEENTQITNNKTQDQIKENVQVGKIESAILLIEEELENHTEQNKNDTHNEVIQQNHEINNILQAEEHNIDDSFMGKEEKVNEKPQRQRPLSKSVSTTSDAFYEISSEGWTEDNEYEEFYDAEDFQNETQLEVIDKELINTNQEVLDENTAAEVEEKLNHKTVLETENTGEISNSPNINRKEDNRISVGLLIDIDCVRSEVDDENVLINITSNTTTNTTEDSNNSVVTNETSLIQINSQNEGKPSSLLLDFGEENKPLKNSNSDLLLGLPNADTSDNGNEVAFQMDLLIDLNEDISSANKETEFVALELNKELKADVENGRKDNLNNQFAPLIEMNTEDKNNSKQIDLQFTDTFDTETENVSNAIHMEYIEEHKSPEEHTHNYIDTISKLENNLDNLQQSPPVTTVEDIATDQMKVWKKQKDEEDKETILQIRAIINDIDQVKLQIDNLSSTNKDQEIHTEMYQTLIKLMRDVNTINNYNFNERIIELQNIALSKVHNCLKKLQIKNT